MGAAFNRLKAAFNQFELGVKLVGFLALGGGLAFLLGAVFGGLLGMAVGQLTLLSIAGGFISLSYMARTIVRIAARLANDLAEKEE